MFDLKDDKLQDSGKQEGNTIHKQCKKNESFQPFKALRNSAILAGDNRVI